MKQFSNLKTFVIEWETCWDEDEYMEQVGRTHIKAKNEDEAKKIFNLNHRRTLINSIEEIK